MYACIALHFYLSSFITAYMVFLSTSIVSSVHHTVSPCASANIDLVKLTGLPSHRAGYGEHTTVRNRDSMHVRLKRTRHVHGETHVLGFRTALVFLLHRHRESRRKHDSQQSNRPGTHTIDTINASGRLRKNMKLYSSLKGCVEAACFGANEVICICEEERRKKRRKNRSGEKTLL